MYRRFKEDIERRGAISFDQTDKNAVYIRSGAEVKVLTKPELARGYTHHDRARDRKVKSTLQDVDLNILDKLSNSQYRTKCGLRFLSLHRVRRRPRPALKCSREYSSLLDSQYAGPAMRLLATVGEWDFNMFTLNKLTNGRALFHTSLHLFQEHNLIEIFKLDIVKLMRFISLVEEGYHSSNPYHNAVHAADVTQAMHCYLRERKMDKALSPLEKMTAIVSAITHDLDHPGVNQAFLIATSNHLATLYNNCSVLENHHWRSAVGLLHESGVFEHFDNSIWKAMEWQLKSLILATDITRQQEFLLRLRNHLDQNNLNLDDIEHKNFVLQIALKCADISNPCRPWELSKRWSELVCDEFFKQGDCERQFNLPVTPFCDRLSTTVAKIQTGFMNFVVMPLFKEWYRFNPTSLSEMMLSNIKANADSWDRISQEAEAQKLKQEQEPLAEEEEDEVEEDGNDTELSSGGHQYHTTVVVIERATGDCEDEKQSPESSASTESIIPDLPQTGETTENDIPLCLYRRHSLPPPYMMCRDSMFPNKRESFQRGLSRRYSLPVGAMPNSNSFDKLVEKLSSLVDSSPTNGTHFDYDQRPRIVSISQNLDAKTLSSAALEASKLTSAHGLDPALLAQRPYTSEPHIAMLAHQYKLNNRIGNLAYLAKNLSVAGIVPRLHSRVQSNNKIESLSTCRQSLPSLSTLPVDGSFFSIPDHDSREEDALGLSAQRVDAVSEDSERLLFGNKNNPVVQNTDKDLLMEAMHSVDAIHLSGVDTADNTDVAHQSTTIAHSSNHITPTLKSPNSQTGGVFSSKHHTTEEEMPLLQPLQNFNKDLSSEPPRSKKSHSNDSFSH